MLSVDLGNVHPGVVKREYMILNTGYLWDEVYCGHFTSTIHPESPKRAEALNFVEIRKSVDHVELIKPIIQISNHFLETVHDKAYIDRVKNAFTKNEKFMDSGETIVREDTYKTALSSSFGAITLTRLVLENKLKNGFAAIRPPGHHAGIQHTRGFCYFNNIAICAKFAQKYFNLKNVLIVDWDVHPGDGTMEIFYEDPSVFVYSIHQKGILTDKLGTEDQLGKNKGLGSTRNISIVKGESSEKYYEIFEKSLKDSCEKFKPEFILISCGFDAHRGDPLGGLNLEEKTFEKMTNFVCDLADFYCKGKVVSLLEGGYNPNILKNCVISHVSTLQNRK